MKEDFPAPVLPIIKTAGDEGLSALFRAVCERSNYR